MMRPVNVKKALAIVIPIVLIVAILYFSGLSPIPSRTPIPSGPVTQYLSVDELENWIGVRIPRPKYLPLGYEIRSVYQIGPKPERPKPDPEKMPIYFYLLYSDEEVNYGNVTSNEDLHNVLQTFGKPGGYKLMLLLTHHTIERTVEDVKNGTLNYIKWVRENENGTDIKLIYINDMPAALETKSYSHTIVWDTQEWGFWLSGYTGISQDELIKIANSVR